MMLMIFVAPFLATHDPIHATPGRELARPSSEYWLGTDRLGRDVWSRLMIGGQRTLGTAMLATGIAVTGGLILGSFTVVGPLFTQRIAQALTEALLAFPALLLALVVRTIMEGSLLTIGIAVGTANIASFARVATDALQSAQLQPHIEGARSIGASDWRIITRHLLPTALPVLMAFASVIFAWSLLYGAALAFLGLGGEPSQPDWGVMIAQARGTLVQAPRLLLLPSALLALSIWSAYRLSTVFNESRI